MSSNLPEEKKAEYERWQPYANALLIGLTVLLAGTAISLSNASKTPITISIIAGIIGILLTVLWFALEDDHKVIGRPAFLWWATVALGTQVTLLAIALLVNLYS